MKTRVDLKFLSGAFGLTLDRRRVVAQFLGLASACLVLQVAGGITRLAGLPAGIGWLLGFPIAYAVLMATAVVVCASCRHVFMAGGDARTFDGTAALTQSLLPAASGAAVFFLAAAVVTLLVGVVLAAGRIHPVVFALIALPLGVVLAGALGLLLFGQLLFPSLAAGSAGDLDAVFSHMKAILRSGLVRVLSQLLVALALASLFTLMLLAILWGGWTLLGDLGGRIAGAPVGVLLGDGPAGFIHGIQLLLLLSAALAPALVFLNASSYLILSTAPAEEASAAAFDEEEEAWLQP